MTELDKLYKRRSDGKVQEWTMQIDGDRYRTVAGIHNGSLVPAKWTTAVSKNVGRSNETTPEEQAQKEAKAKWQKKLDGEYSLDAEDVDNIGWFKPMLAKPYDKYKHKLEFPVYVQPKLDGIRAIGMHGALQSRKGKKFVATPHIVDDLDQAFEDYTEYMPLGLDGELYCNKYSNDFEKIVSIVRKQKPTEKDLALAEQDLEYWVYDAPSEKPFADRWADVMWVAGLMVFGLSIKTVPTFKCKSFEDIDKYYRLFLEQGYEGQIIRANGPYEQKRSSLLLKRKEFIDEEFTIKGFEEGLGNRSGMVGRVVLELDHGKIFGANIRGSHKYLTKLFQSPESSIGKKATVRYFERTAHNVPRFPVVVAIRDYE